MYSDFKNTLKSEYKSEYFRYSIKWITITTVQLFFDTNLITN